MKVSLVCISFFIYSFTFGQQASLQKLWVGDANNYFKIDTPLVYAESWFTSNGKVIPATARFRKDCNEVRDKTMIRNHFIQVSTDC